MEQMMLLTVSNDNCDKFVMSNVENDGKNRNLVGIIPKRGEECQCRKCVDIAILWLGNLLNYMDRYLLAGILIDIQNYFHIKNAKAGLIQTSFVIVYMAAAPISGYLGDRYNRKVILVLAIFVWNAGNVSCSFMNKFWAFLVCRGLLGIGQATYTTIAPSIISDLFTGEKRSKILAFFYSAIPLGSGLGYIVGAQITELFHSWKWCLRISPILSLIILLFMLIFLRNPKRGVNEGTTNIKSTSWLADMKYLFKNKTFMLLTMGFTTVSFSSGAIAWWAPKLIFMGFHLKGAKINPHTGGAIYGAIAAGSGILGLCIGHSVTVKFKQKYPQIDPLVCALGLLISGPILIGTTYMATYNEFICYGLLFLGLAMLNMIWSIICDILLYVVLPMRRSSAIGLQLFIGHGFGDAGSPYLLGLVSDVIYDYLKEGEEFASEYDPNRFKALQYSFFIACVVASLGAPIFFIATFFIVSDREKVLRGEK